MSRDYGELADSIVDYVSRFGPLPVATLARVLKRQGWVIEAAVMHSFCLVVTSDGMVTFDEMVDDPDYGLVCRKELNQLRAECAPTLAEIRSRCDKLRRTKQIVRLSSKLCPDNNDIELQLAQLIESDHRAIWMTAKGLAIVLGCRRSDIIKTRWWQTYKAKKTVSKVGDQQCAVFRK